MKASDRYEQIRAVTRLFFFGLLAAGVLLIHGPATALQGWPNLPTDAQIKQAQTAAEQRALQPDPSKISVIDSRILKKYDPSISDPVAGSAVILLLVVGRPCAGPSNAGSVSGIACPDGFWEATWGFVESLEYSSGSWTFRVAKTIGVPASTNSRDKIDTADLDRWALSNYQGWQDGWPSAAAPTQVAPSPAPVTNPAPAPAPQTPGVSALPELTAACADLKSQALSYAESMDSAVEGLNSALSVEIPRDTSTYEGYVSLVSWRTRAWQAAWLLQQVYTFTPVSAPPSMEGQMQVVQTAAAASAAAIDPLLAAISATTGDRSAINAAVTNSDRIDDTLMSALDDLISAYQRTCTQ